MQATQDSGTFRAARVDHSEKLIKVPIFKGFLWENELSFEAGRAPKTPLLWLICTEQPRKLPLHDSNIDQLRSKFINANIPQKKGKRTAHKKIIKFCHSAA